MSELGVVGKYGETLGCGCTMEMNRHRKIAKLELCSEEHARRFWMRWADSIEHLPADLVFDGPAYVRPLGRGISINEHRQSLEEILEEGDCHLTVYRKPPEGGTDE